MSHCKYRVIKREQELTSGTQDRTNDNVDGKFMKPKKDEICELRKNLPGKEGCVYPDRSTGSCPVARNFEGAILVSE